MAIPMRLELMTVGFGLDSIKSIESGLAAVPLLYTRTRLDIPTGNRLSRKRLRMIAYPLILGIEVSAIWRPL